MKPSKYKAKKSECDGIVFDSKVEMEYYKDLKEMKSDNVIKSFKLQPSYLLQEAFITSDGEKIRAITYKADFEVEYHGDLVKVIDIKGLATPISLMKRKMFLRVHQYKYLEWLSYVKKYGGWVDYFELKKLRKKNKK